MPSPRPAAPDLAVSTKPPAKAPGPRGAQVLASEPGQVKVGDGEMPAEELACRKRLEAIGVGFKASTPKSDPSGCLMPFPLIIDTLGKDIALEPDAELNCAMAEAAALFAVDVISPAAEKAFGERLKTVGHASAYVCRPRNGTQKLSEHAFGNALDIARFNLSKGTTVDVEATTDAKKGEFLAAIRKAACGPFKTVLGPGSDADHAQHLHFDLAKRRNGGTFCQ